MHIVITTAGGAGMFCGSCMQDNTLARALMAAGHRVTLVPLYTPIRVDEADASERRVFLGGINTYIAGNWPMWGRIPRAFTSWLDSPRLLRLVSRLAVSSDARELGGMTVQLLQGDQGPHQQALADLARHLGEELKPDVVIFSNAMLGGVIPALRQHYTGPIWCLLQGDDIFLKDLVEPYRSQALELLYQIASKFDRVLTHSHYYLGAMSEMLQFPVSKGRVIPLGIDLTGHDGVPSQRTDPTQPFRIGYFARICPEKGIHLLIDAFRLVHQQHPNSELVAAGYLGKRDHAWFSQIQHDARDLGKAFQYAGSPADHAGKVAFLKTLDLFSVPTTYKEPKGISVLEAMANGRPVVQPAHGAFPELIESTNGGILCEPENPKALAASLESLLVADDRRIALAQAGYCAVRDKHNSATMANAVVKILCEP